ncbi:unnamed protein product, partial [Prorocentrum cordatum]
RWPRGFAGRRLLRRRLGAGAATRAGGRGRAPLRPAERRAPVDPRGSQRARSVRHHGLGPDARSQRRSGQRCESVGLAEPRVHLHPGKIKPRADPDGASEVGVDAGHGGSLRWYRGDLGLPGCRRQLCHGAARSHCEGGGGAI